MFFLPREFLFPSDQPPQPRIGFSIGIQARAFLLSRGTISSRQIDNRRSSVTEFQIKRWSNSELSESMLTLQLLTTDAKRRLQEPEDKLPFHYKHLPDFNGSGLILKIISKKEKRENIIKFFV